MHKCSELESLGDKDFSVRGVVLTDIHRQVTINFPPGSRSTNERLFLAWTFQFTNKEWQAQLDGNSVVTSSSWKYWGTVAFLKADD